MGRGADDPGRAVCRGTAGLVRQRAVTAGALARPAASLCDGLDHGAEADLARLLSHGRNGGIVYWEDLTPSRPAPAGLFLRCSPVGCGLRAPTTCGRGDARRHRRT